jgi:hypothetical protein
MEKFNLMVKISGTPVRDLTGGTPYTPPIKTGHTNLINK